MSAPLLAPASTTSTPKEHPLMMRLRMGNVWRSALTRMENSVMTAPEVAIFSASSLFSGG